MSQTQHYNKHTEIQTQHWTQRLTFNFETAWHSEMPTKKTNTLGLRLNIEKAKHTQTQLPLLCLYVKVDTL